MTNETFNKQVQMIENFDKPKTKDGLNFDSLKTVYFVNKDIKKVEAFSKNELIAFGASVAKADGTQFDIFNQSLNTDDFYGSESAAVNALIEAVRFSIDYHKKQIALSEKLIEGDEAILGKLIQQTAVYVKPVSSKPVTIENGMRI